TPGDGAQIDPRGRRRSATGDGRPGRAVPVQRQRGAGRISHRPDVVGSASPDAGERARAGVEGGPAATVEAPGRDLLEVALQNPDVVRGAGPDGGERRVGETEPARHFRAAGEGTSVAPGPSVGA